MSKAIRETVSLDQHIIGLLFNEYAYETIEYEKYFDEDGEPLPGTILDEYEFVESNIDYTDLEKSYQKIEVIVRRLSDGKFFKGFYTSTAHDNYFDDFELEEVFPTTTTITTYW